MTSAVIIWIFIFSDDLFKWRSYALRECPPPNQIFLFKRDGDFGILDRCDIKNSIVLDITPTFIDVSLFFSFTINATYYLMCLD